VRVALLLELLKGLGLAEVAQHVPGGLQPTHRQLHAEVERRTQPARTCWKKRTSGTPLASKGPASR
jgi:hypothetical protein